MRNRARHQLFVMGLSVASPWLVGMVACNDGSGGIVLSDDDAGAGRGGSKPKGGSAGMEMAGNGGEVDAGEAGSTATGSGGTSGSTTGKGGSQSQGSGGSKQGKGGTGGSDNTGNTGNTAHEAAGAGGDETADAGAPSASEGGSGGDPGVGESGAGGTGGTTTGGSGAGPLPNCIFHSDPVVSGAAGSGGMAGTAGAGGAPPMNPHGLAVGTNAFVGPYLTDLSGYALYIYGADFPGDCSHPPVSNCYADCAQSWPIFNANERTLPTTLSDAAFGTLDRGDGTFQTTYDGWPLYYYKSDTAPNVINGQGKGKTWFAAELVLPNLVVMRGPVATGGVKFLGDDHGWTLYSVAGDVPGTATQAAVSNCTGTCLDSFQPFGGGDVFPCTSLEPHDVTLFLRGDGRMQAAYRGLPLYYSHADQRSGDELGVGVLGGALVLP